jgi:putative methionine-R-sulfoxide reductase with GAF domain
MALAEMEGRATGLWAFSWCGMYLTRNNRLINGINVGSVHGTRHGNKQTENVKHKHSIRHVSCRMFLGIS